MRVMALGCRCPCGPTQRRKVIILLVALLAVSASNHSGAQALGSEPQPQSTSAVLVYGNPAVVDDPHVPEVLLAVVRNSTNAQGGRYEVVASQPPSLVSLLEIYNTAAYIIPFQGPQKTPYAAAVGTPADGSANTTSNAALSILRDFVRRGGNLIFLGNTVQSRSLTLISQVLGRPHGCKVATATYKLNPSSANIFTSMARAGLQDLPLTVATRAGGEAGGVGLLACTLQPIQPPSESPSACSGNDTNSCVGAVPLFSDAGSAPCTTVPPKASVGPAFAWMLARGRIFWMGVTFDASTATAGWARLLAAAATTPPLPNSNGSTGSPPQGLPQLRPIPPPPKPAPSRPRPPSPLPPRPRPPSPSPLRPSPTPPSALPPPTPPRPQPVTNPDNDALLPPGAVIEEDPPSPPSTPLPPDFPVPPNEPASPPAPPPSPPERPCEDWSDASQYNCTAWMEYPDLDFCEPDYVVSPPTGSGPDLSVLRDICPRSCGFCCTDKYFDCERWADEGYCSWMYVSTDPDTFVEETVPQACQQSCRVCASSEQQPPPPQSTVRRRLLMDKDRRKQAADPEPSSKFASLDKDWQEKALWSAGKKQLIELDLMFKENRQNLPFNHYSAEPGTLIKGPRGGPHLDIQTVFDIEGQKINEKQALRFAAIDFQSGDGKQGSFSYARAYVPLGFNVPTDALETALRQSALRKRPVSILPPHETIFGKDGKMTTTFQSFSKVKPDESVQWTLVEAKLASKLPKDFNNKASENYVVFNGKGDIELSHPKANIACATCTSTIEVEPLNNLWNSNAKPGGCTERGGGRGLLQSCPFSDEGNNGNNGNNDNNGGRGNSRDCQIRWVRNKDGKRVRRQVCQQDSNK